MITIIHGDDTAVSRKYFIEQKEKVKNPQTFDGSATTFESILQIVEGGGLFSQEKNIFLENLIFAKKSKSRDEIVSFIESRSNDANFFIWEGRELSKNQLKEFARAQIKSFLLPKEIFSFLDSIKPNLGQTSIRKFHALIKYYEPELVFFMLIRQFRILLALSSGHPEHSEGSRWDSSSTSDVSQNDIDEVARLAPWQRGKLEKQASFFSKEKLVELYRKLFNIDYGIKTGTSPLSLIQSIDFFLLDL